MKKSLLTMTLLLLMFVSSNNAFHAAGSGYDDIGLDHSMIIDNKIYNVDALGNKAIFYSLDTFITDNQTTITSFTTNELEKAFYIGFENGQIIKINENAQLEWTKQYTNEMVMKITFNHTQEQLIVDHATELKHSPYYAPEDMSTTALYDYNGNLITINDPTNLIDTNNKRLVSDGKFTYLISNDNILFIDSIGEIMTDKTILLSSLTNQSMGDILSMNDIIKIMEYNPNEYYIISTLHFGNYGLIDMNTNSYYLTPHRTGVDGVDAVFQFDSRLISFKTFGFNPYTTAGMPYTNTDFSKSNMESNSLNYLDLSNANPEHNIQSTQFLKYEDEGFILMHSPRDNKVYLAEYTGGEFIFNSLLAVEPMDFISKNINATASSYGTPQITLNGAAYIYLDHNEAYQELNATAVDPFGNQYTVSIDGSVDTSTPGNYTITYTVKDSFGDLHTETRIVTVNEPEPTYDTPTLTLEGGESIFLDRESAYIEPGASAVDSFGNEYAVSITGTVDTSQVGLYIITYTVTDNGGNDHVKHREVFVQSDDAPEFDAPIHIIKNSEYIANSDFYLQYITASSTDNIDITSDIEIIENEYNGNANIPGSYEMIFRVTDEFGTTARHTLIISVQKDISPLLIIDQTKMVLSDTQEMGDDDFIQALKDIDILPNETFVFTDTHDTYLNNYDVPGDYAKAFNVLSESGVDYDFTLNLSVIEDDSLVVESTPGIINKSLDFMSTWWPGLIVVALVVFGIRKR